MFMQDNICLAGESAGAVYTHANIALGAPVKRAILASGGLYLSPSRPRATGDALIARLNATLGPDTDLRSASSEAIIKALEDCEINSMWLQLAEGLYDWQELDYVDIPLMIGDVEFEVSSLSSLKQ